MEEDYYYSDEEEYGQAKPKKVQEELEEIDTRKEISEDKLKKNEICRIINSLSGIDINSSKKYEELYDFINRSALFYKEFNISVLVEMVNENYSELKAHEYEQLLNNITSINNFKIVKEASYNKNYGDSEYKFKKNTRIDKLNDLLSLKKFIIDNKNFMIINQEIIKYLDGIFLEYTTDPNTDNSIFCVVLKIQDILNTLRDTLQIKKIENSVSNYTFSEHTYFNNKCTNNIKEIFRHLSMIGNLENVYLLTDETKPHLFRFMIIGPEKTPYQGGFFIFDGLFDDFPNSPPKITFLTTDGGRFRFNPNLYACGKVCLSLLGTWSGPSWSPENSTLLQVLLSIQSLILVEEPYYNEPGRSNCPKNSEEYNEFISEGTKKIAIKSVLKNIDKEPNLGFKEKILQKTNSHSSNSSNLKNE